MGRTGQLLETLQRINSLDSESGAYKQVDIYENYVVKRQREEEYSRASYSEAKDNSDYYDDNGDFHYSWVESECNSVSDEDSAREMEMEFEYAKRKSHLPIIAPILDGDQYEYVMPRVKTVEEVHRDLNNAIPDKYFEIKEKRIKMSVLRKLNQSRVRITFKELDQRSRLSDMIRLAINAKLPEKNIIQDIYYFYMENIRYGILQDMHSSNYGIYKKHITAFDFGQRSYRSRTLKTYIKDIKKSSKQDMQDKLDFLSHEKYYLLSKYKREKTPLKVVGKDRLYYIGDIRKGYRGSLIVDIFEINEKKSWGPTITNLDDIQPA